MSENKPVDKVYINIRKIILDYETEKNEKTNKFKIAQFVIKNGAPKTKLVAISRKIDEASKYELTFTEAYNMAKYMGLSMGEFFDKYCKAI